ncbi:MAG: 50S ribosomal protein L24 [Verrucomicrobiota bacterium]|jgi:large subunit ribosomal protein L24|nr:50S ribosomal protein L24 [Verrucomicrobiota bacterium]|tara:strand:- start:18 stop:383 length:366 start_codon:yes stop_codon:yes gene_type:complete
MSRIKTHVKIGDQVEVIAGNDKGEKGKVLQVLPKKQQVIIEGVRMIKKHSRKSQDRPDGGIIELEGPIHISNVKKIDAKLAKKATKKAAKKAAKKATKKAAKKVAEPAEEIDNDTETKENS